MSVLIKDMEMPDNCDVCLFSGWNHLHQTACCKLKKYQAVFHDYSTEYREKRSDMCPLFEASDLCGDAEFWRRRADYYSDMCSKLIADMGAGVKIEAVKIDETGITFTKKKPSAQAETNCSEIPNNWIPCSERLPETEGVYIITDDAGGMATVELDKFICRDDGWFTWLYAQNATAWMPLPEPYRGEEK